MIEVFYEETVTPKDSVQASKRYKRTRLLSRMFLFSAIMFTVLLFFIMSVPLDEGANIGNFLLFNVLPLLIFCVIFYGLYIYLRIKKHNHLVDFDYTFVSGELRIAKILNGIKRKPVAKINCGDITVLGKKSSDKFLRYKTMPNMKIITATPNEFANEADDIIYFMVCTYNGAKTILIFEPSVNLLYNIKKFAGRTVDYV
jgi:hypothetical protein